MHADGAYNKDDCPVLTAHMTADVGKKARLSPMRRPFVVAVHPFAAVDAGHHSALSQG